MSNKKTLYYTCDGNTYKLVKRKSVERKRVLYQMHYSGWKCIKEGMSAVEAGRFIKLLGLKLRS